MGNKINIDGKEYTERTIESLEVNGQISESNIIDASSFGKDYTIEININTGEEIRSLSKEQLQLIQEQSIRGKYLQTMEAKESDKEKELYSENKEPVQNTEQISLLNRFIKFIKNIFYNKS